MRAAALIFAIFAACERGSAPPKSFDQESVAELQAKHRVLAVFEQGDDRVLSFREGENDYLVVFYRRDFGAFRPYGSQHHLVNVEAPVLRAGWVEARMRGDRVWMRLTAGGSLPSPIQERGISVGAPQPR